MVVSLVAKQESPIYNKDGAISRLNYGWEVLDLNQ